MSRNWGANIKVFEDEVWCRAYISVSVDSIQGANQTLEKLWEVVTVKYHEQPGIIVQRTLSSLQPRFSAISTAVQLYVAKLSHAINNADSGTNEMDWVILYFVFYNFIFY